MTRIKLLFAPENIGFAEKIAGALAEHGYAMAGDDAPASAVLVIWSPGAASSPTILSAARGALARRVLVPVALGKAPPPPSFEHLWPMDLSGWNGGAEDPRWRFVLDEIELAVRRGVEVAEEVIQAPAPPARRKVVEPARPEAKAAPTAEADDLEDIFAAQPLYQASAVAAPPYIPKAAVAGVAALFAVIGAGAFLIGKAQVSPAAEPAAASPVVAFVQPKDPSAEEIAAVEAEPPPPTETAPSGALAPVQSDDEEAERVGGAAAELRDPAATIENQPIEAATGAKVAAALPAADAPPPPRVKQETIASLAEDALRESETPASEEEPIGAEGDAEGDADPIGALAWDATRDAAIADPGAVDPAITETASLGSYFRDCVDCPDMAEIRTAGAAFALGVREVTFGQWLACVADAACPPIASQAGGKNMPVIKISYGDALAYVAWLSNKTGVRYRLPREQEWNDASGGAAPDASGANLKSPQLFRGRAIAAGSFAPNAFGLYDMAGNVWEWTEDCWIADGATTAAVGGCGARVLKGGAYDTPVPSLAGDARDGAPEAERRRNTGFRVARDLN